MQRERINIVNENNEVIDIKYRDEVDYDTDIYQASALWLRNGKGDVLMAQRKLTKDKDPGLWGPTVSGTVSEGETQDTNIVKEIEEEIGVRDLDLTTGPLVRMKKPRHNFTQWFFATLDVPLEHFTPQESEVEKLEWVSEKELLSSVESSPEDYTPFLRIGLSQLIN